MRIGAIILAGGCSRRMGGANKLLMNVGSKPVLQHVIEAVVRSQARPIMLVTGHDRENVERLEACDTVQTVHNPDFEAGMSASLRCGVRALQEGMEGLLICLGDMPFVGSELLDRMIAAFDPGHRREIVVPVFNGQRGNPVLIGSRFFPELLRITGDVGAKRIVEGQGDYVFEVVAGDDGVLRDVDTMESFPGTLWPQ